MRTIGSNEPTSYPEYQFYHYNKEGPVKKYTLALKNISKGELEIFLQDAIFDPLKEIVLHFGIANLHPKDSYCKAIGREKAIEKIEATPFTLVSVEPDENNGCIITLVKDIMFIALRIHKNSDKIWFVNGYVCLDSERNYV